MNHNRLRRCRRCRFVFVPMNNIEPICDSCARAATDEYFARKAAETRQRIESVERDFPEGDGEIRIELL